MYFLFQCSPKRFDLAGLLESGAHPQAWSVNDHRKLVSPGDRVFFWQTGPEARLLAVGHVTSPVYERVSPFGPYCVDVTFDFKIWPPLSRRADVEQNESLRKFSPFKGIQGTNFRIGDPLVLAELEKKLANRLVPLNKASNPGIEESQRLLDDAIKRAKRETENKSKNSSRKWIRRHSNG